MSEHVLLLTVMTLIWLYSFRCDADPAALAKYVVALVKKDKAPEELKHVCIDQLEVFLSDGKKRK